MAGYVPILLILAFFLMVSFGTFVKGEGFEPKAGTLLTLGLVGIVAVLRIFDILVYFQGWMLYGGMVTLTYVIIFYAAYFRYKDPAAVTNRERAIKALKKRRAKVAYVVPVHNEPYFIVRCINSILEAADYARARNIDVQIVVVDDASTDNTWEVLQQFIGIPNVKLVNLEKNAGKKGSLAIGTCGGINWRDAYALNTGDIVSSLWSVGCTPPSADYFLYTDSDSIISREFIFHQVVAFLTNDRLGALSGHCDVWLDPDSEPTFMTKLQVAWYYTQFRIRKAAESAYGSVFCVSGPGAGFRAEAVYPTLLRWVDDHYGPTRIVDGELVPRIYRGATDRMLTLLILQAGWRVEYSASAVAYTVVPKNIREARAQWTRWKQNFWRMLVPVWKFAWQVAFPVAFLTYARILITIFAPFIMLDHLFALLLGDQSGSLIYFLGLMLMGSLMGVAFTAKNPSMWRYGLYRPVMSIVSAIWGNTVTLRAFVKDRKQQFTWRELEKGGVQRGRIVNRFWTPTFETRLLTWVLLIVVIIRLVEIGLQLM